MLNASFGGSVVKREARSIDEVDKKLRNDGWDRTSSILNGRLRYYSNSGVNITAFSGPLGTLIIPSGPVRGKLFGDTELVSGASVIGLGKKTKSKDNPSREKDVENSDRPTL